MQAGVFAERGALHCIKSTYEEQGVGGFYQVIHHRLCFCRLTFPFLQGIGVTLLKVLPFALFMYFVFLFSNQWFERHERDERFAALHSVLHTYWRALSVQLEAGSSQWRTHAQRQFNLAE